MRRGYWGVLLICACGARSEIAGSGGDEWLDGSIFDVTSNDGHSDGSPFGTNDSGTDASACTPLVTKIGCANACENCKFDVEWTCGDTKYAINGYCDPATLVPDAAFLEGACSEDGTHTSTFKEPAATCDCNDASALVTILQAQCTHQ